MTCREHVIDPLLRVGINKVANPEMRGLRLSRLHPLPDDSNPTYLVHMHRIPATRAQNGSKQKGTLDLQHSLARSLKYKYEGICF